MDWLIQEAAKDLVNAEEEAIGEERREEDGVGEEGGPAFTNEDLPDEEEDAVEVLKDGAEEAGRAFMEDTLLEERVGDKQARAPETAFGEVKPSGDKGVGEDAGTALNGEEQGGARPQEEEGGREEEVEEALTGEGERFLKLGLNADGAGESSGSWLEVIRAELGGSTRLDDGHRMLGNPDPCWSSSLELTEKHNEKTLKLFRWYMAYIF